MAASSNHPETMRATRSLYNSEVCYPETSVPALLVTLLAGEWSSSASALSTINRELAIHLSNHSAVGVSLLVPEGACNHEDKNEASSYGITVVEAKRRAAFDRPVLLNSPPTGHVMDVVVGHGVKLGRQVQFIRDSARFPNCKWVQVVHTAPEDLSRYKCYSDPISKGETKHESEFELCKLADLVVTVGPRLKEAYTSFLQRCKTDQDVLSITPGLFQREFGDLVAKQVPNEDGKFKVLLFGRGDPEDFELKGYNIAAQAFTEQRLKNKPYHLIFVGAPGRKQEEVRGKLLQRGIAEAQLTVRKFIQKRKSLKGLLCEADLAIMPSKSEGFDLVALEALSAGLPILVGSRSGFARALENVPHGKACIVNSDDPAEWAKAIEAVRINHRKTLKEIKSVRASYGEIYSWKEQCETFVNRMRRLGRDASHTPEDVSVTKMQPAAKAHALAPGFSEDQCPVNEDTKTEDAICYTPSTSGLASDRDASHTPEDVSVTEMQPAAKAHASAPGFSEDQCPVNEETKTEDAICHTPSALALASGRDASHTPEDVSVTEMQPAARAHASAPGFSEDQCPVNEDTKTGDAICHTPSASGLASDREVANDVKILISARDLKSELVDKVDKMLRQHLQLYLEYNTENKLSTVSGLRDFVEHLEKTYNFILTSVGEGSLVIKGQCSDLQSQESLWNDCCSGVLNEAAERCLVTDDVKKEINLETLILKVIMEKSELPERYIFNLLRQIERQAKEDTNNHETGLYENFKRNIKEKNFSISDNQGGGNCMFLALSEQLYLKKGIKISQAELRQTVVQYLKKNPTLPDGTELFHFVDGCSSWDVYLTRMMADGTWGDHVILHGAANHFQTCIHVISSHHDEVMICREYDASTRLVLGHVHELHYVSLIPHKGDTHVPQGGKKPSFEQIEMTGYADKDDNAKVGKGRSVIATKIVKKEGTSWALKVGTVHLIFPPDAVPESTPAVVYRWKYSVCSPPLQEHEAIVSNVIEVSSHDGQQVHFNAMVTLSLSHSAPNLRGYEVVIQRQINKKTNEWEDVRGTKNLSCRQDIEAERPCHEDIPDLFFPVAEAYINDCSTYAAVCRLKSSPNYTVTSTGGLFSHPDYPGVTIEIPENAVAPESRFTLKLKVQEVPNKDFEEEGVFHGPILRIKCFEVVQFFRPVTIQLPVSLRDRQDVKLDPSKCHVRVFFLNCEEEKNKWKEPTDLVEPTQFDGKFVRIQHKIQRFSRYSFCVERREENSGAYGLRTELSYLTRFTKTQPRAAYFITYFNPDISNILLLICCPAHLRPEVVQDLRERNIKCADGNSMTAMIPGEDKAFVFLSGGICPFNKEDVNNIHLMLLEEHPFKTELRVCLVDSEDLAQVEFRHTLKQTDGTHFLCRLHLTSPRANSREPAPQPQIKGGSPTPDVLEGLSEKISDKWKKLGRRLKFDEAKITEHEKSNDKVSEKAYKLLLAWKRRDASAATYRVLHEALNNVERRDLAEEFCCQ